MLINVFLKFLECYDRNYFEKNILNFDGNFKAKMKSCHRDEKFFIEIGINNF